MDAMVAAVDVHKYFGALHALAGVSLEVPRGDVSCIIGPSGSGKSTFLRCINQLERPDKGAIFVDGALIGYRRVGDALHELSDRELARQRLASGMVFQRFNLFQHLTALQNVTEGPITVQKRQRREATDEALALLARVGLADKRDAYPIELSGGQQQRVAIARALAMQPAVLLCDEITSALDPELVGEVLRVVESLAEDGMTLLMVTHEMNFARKVSDRLIFMHQGKVHEMGPPDELFGAPKTPELKQFLSSLD
ncbi:MAG: amino acid ABC transporter ATP-binding protein [Microvirga sp.]